MANNQKHLTITFTKTQVRPNDSGKPASLCPDFWSCYHQALREAGKLTDSARIEVERALALTNLGSTLWLMQHLDEALACLQTTLKEREETPGHNGWQSMIKAHMPKCYAFRVHKLPYSTSRILHCLGNVRCNQDFLEASFEYHQRALLHFIESVGGSHHRTGNSCFKVAEHYSCLGNLSDTL